MRIGSLAGYLQEAVDDGDAGDETPVVLVLRNPHAGLDDDDAWLEAHLANVERDIDDNDLVATEDADSGLSGRLGGSTRRYGRLMDCSRLTSASTRLTRR